MAIRFDYVLRETANNLVRNLLLSLASIITFTVSLGILGGAVLAIKAIDHAFEKWRDGVEFIVYMKPGVEQDKIKAVEQALNDSPQVQGFDFVDTNETWKEFKEYFEDQPDITKALSPEELPQSFRVRPKDPKPEVTKVLGESFEDNSGVYKVEFPEETVKQLETTFSRLSTVFLILALVLLVASAMLIVFMIQTAVFARRREIEVQRLVGATNWFIRIPFIMEGIVHAVIGWVLATASLWGLTWAWRSRVVASEVRNFFGEIVWENGDVWNVSLILFAVAMVVGMIGSALSVGWYLKA